MSKAIIEIEKPKCCKQCVWYQADKWFGGSCVLSKDENGWNKQIRADDEYYVQKWCPLLSKNDAIPVVWIDTYCTDCSIDLRDNDAKAIKKLLEDWRKENGTE